MFSCVAMKIEFLRSWFSCSKLCYKKEIKNPNSRHIKTIELWNQKKRGRKKKSRNKLRSQIENIIVRATIKYNECNKIYNGCSYFLFLFLIRIHSMQGWTATTRHWLTRKRSTKRLKHTGNLFRKEPTVKRCLLILDLKSFRSYVKGKHSIGREFHSLAVQGKKLLT